MVQAHQGRIRTLYALDEEVEGKQGNSRDGVDRERRIWCVEGSTVGETRTDRMMGQGLSETFHLIAK